MPGPHEILGVSADASLDEIQHAYRTLSQIYHPDRYVDAPATVQAEAQRRMQELNTARDALTQSTNQSARQHHSAATPPPQPPPRAEAPLRADPVLTRRFQSEVREGIALGNKGFRMGFPRTWRTTGSDGNRKSLRLLWHRLDQATKELERYRQRPELRHPTEFVVELKAYEEVLRAEAAILELEVYIAHAADSPVRIQSLERFKQSYEAKAAGHKKVVEANQADIDRWQASGLQPTDNVTKEGRVWRWATLSHAESTRKLPLRYWRWAAVMGIVVVVISISLSSISAPRPIYSAQSVTMTVPRVSWTDLLAYMSTDPDNGAYARAIQAPAAQASLFLVSFLCEDPPPNAPGTWTPPDPVIVGSTASVERLQVRLSSKNVQEADHWLVENSCERKYGIRSISQDYETNFSEAGVATTMADARVLFTHATPTTIPTTSTGNNGAEFCGFWHVNIPMLDLRASYPAVNDDDGGKSVQFPGIVVGEEPTSNSIIVEDPSSSPPYLLVQQPQPPVTVSLGQSLQIWGTVESNGRVDSAGAQIAKTELVPAPESIGTGNNSVVVVQALRMTNLASLGQICPVSNPVPAPPFNTTTTTTTTTTVSLPEVAGCTTDSPENEYQGGASAIWITCKYGPTHLAGGNPNSPQRDTELADLYWNSWASSGAIGNGDMYQTSSNGGGLDDWSVSVQLSAPSLLNGTLLFTHLDVTCDFYQSDTNTGGDACTGGSYTIPIQPGS